MLARYVIYFYFLKNVTASIGCYIDTCVHTSSRLLKLGSNFHEICLARRVSTGRSHPYILYILIIRGGGGGGGGGGEGSF